MKKLIPLLLIFALVLTGCENIARKTADWTPQGTLVLTDPPQTTKAPETLPEPGRALTYEEMIALPTQYYQTAVREEYDSLEEFLELMGDVPFAITRGEVTEVHHYLQWDGVRASGFTVSTVQITGIDAVYNSLALQPGERIQVYEPYLLRFTDSAENVVYFADKAGKKISLGEWTELDPGIQELIPTAGNQYEKLFTKGVAEIPMCEGKRYSFCIREYDTKIEGFEKLYAVRGIACQGMSDVDAFLKQADLDVERDLLMIARVIQERFPA